jgi:molybdopterin-guanine dinucleotide biosynthesis protein A
MNSEKFRVCVIFAGGKSSRMGEDKSLLPFGTFSSLAEYQYNRLSNIFDIVYILFLRI